MHTYVRSGQLWQVLFDNGNTKCIMRGFDKERDAARYASFLNGGFEPAWVSEKLD